MPDLKPMLRALQLCHEAMRIDEIPVGCVITDSHDVILAEAHNETSQNFLHHAEFLAIQRALAIPRADGSPRKRLDGHHLYVTLEPCSFCAAAIALTRIHSIYYGARDQKMGAIESSSNFFEQAICHHKPLIYGGIHGDESSQLLQSFFQKKRQKPS